jgi:hypothetical protein
LSKSKTAEKKRKHANIIGEQEQSWLTKAQKFIFGMGIIGWSVVCFLLCSLVSSFFRWFTGLNLLCVIGGFLQLWLFKFVDSIYREPKNAKKKKK